NLDEYTDLVMDPTDPQKLWAAVGTWTGKSANGVYLTTDGGVKWTAAGNFPSGTGDGRIAIAIAPSAPKTLYAAIASPGGGSNLLQMLTTTDGGSTWTQLKNTPEYMNGLGWYSNTLAVDPNDSQTVIAAGGVNGIIISNDGGQSWLNWDSGA